MVLDYHKLDHLHWSLFLKVFVFDDFFDFKVIDSVTWVGTLIVGEWQMAVNSDTSLSLKNSFFQGQQSSFFPSTSQMINLKFHRSIKVDDRSQWSMFENFDNLKVQKVLGALIHPRTGSFFSHVTTSYLFFHHGGLNKEFGSGKGLFERTNFPQLSFRRSFISPKLLGSSFFELYPF